MRNDEIKPTKMTVGVPKSDMSEGLARDPAVVPFHPSYVL